MKALFKYSYIAGIFVLMFSLFDDGFSQPHLVSEEKVIFYTQEWNGERDQYGRPMVPDDIIERLKHVDVEEAWGTLRDLGYNNQLEAGWEILNPEEVMVGRALTTAFLPRRAELDDRLTAIGRDMGLGGGTNQWPMGLLVEGDIIVADHYGKLREAAFFGNNLMQSIYSSSGNGPIVYGQGRDIVGVREIEGANVWVKAWHPSSSANRMLISINDIIRIGEAVVLPGDVVLASEAGVIFIPPHLAEKVIVSSEVVRIIDGFRIESMEAGRYSSQQVYTNPTQWTEEVNTDFFTWLENDRVRLNNEYNVSFEIIDWMIDTKDLNWQNWFE